MCLWLVSHPRLSPRLPALHPPLLQLISHLNLPLLPSYQLSSFTHCHPSPSLFQSCFSSRLTRVSSSYLIAFPPTHVPLTCSLPPSFSPVLLSPTISSFFLLLCPPLCSPCPSPLQSFFCSLLKLKFLSPLPPPPNPLPPISPSLL